MEQRGRQHREKNAEIQGLPDSTVINLSPNGHKA
jgi:hypothetical protein